MSELQEKVEKSIKRLQTFEPPEGYYLAFSGGKDSVVIKALADMAGVKYDAHYNVTSVDPPELIYFIKDHHPDVIWDYPRRKDGTRITMWNLIGGTENYASRGLPTRLQRFCCKELKERGGEGRTTVTGVRWAESVQRRRRRRSGLELVDKYGEHEHIDPDNPQQGITHICPTGGKIIINPIVDWDDDDVWGFIKSNNIPYCKLYDQGKHRLGCIGCPMNQITAAAELQAYPKYARAYLKAVKRHIRRKEKRSPGFLKKYGWHDEYDIMDWWLTGKEWRNPNEVYGDEKRQAAKKLLENLL